MSSKSDGKNERITVNLDPESLERLDDLESELRTSKSEVIRRALEYHDIILDKEDLTPEELETILDLRLRPDNLLFDIGIFQAFLEEIGEPSDKLREEIKRIGGNFYQDYCAIGISEPIKCLERLERTNLYRLIVESDTKFTIIPMIPEMGVYLKIFFEGYLEPSDLSAEVTISRNKIRIDIDE